MNYPEGKTSNILWNVAETGCGSAPVTVAEPGHRNPLHLHPVPTQRRQPGRLPRRRGRLLLLRQPQLLPPVPGVLRPHRRRETAPGTAVGAGPANGAGRSPSPNNAYVTPAAWPADHHGAHRRWPRGIAAGFAMLGMPYVWGGGGPGAGANNGCARGGGAIQLLPALRSGSTAPG